MKRYIMHIDTDENENHGKKRGDLLDQREQHHVQQNKELSLFFQFYFSFLYIL